MPNSRANLSASDLWVRGSSLRNQWRLLGLERQGASEFLSQRMTHRARVGRFCGALGLACGRVNRSAKDTPEALGQLSSDEGEGVAQGVGETVGSQRFQSGWNPCQRQVAGVSHLPVTAWKQWIAPRSVLTKSRPFATASPWARPFTGADQHSLPVAASNAATRSSPPANRVAPARIKSCG